MNHSVESEINGMPSNGRLHVCTYMQDMDLYVIAKVPIYGFGLCMNVHINQFRLINIK